MMNSRDVCALSITDPDGPLEVVPNSQDLVMREAKCGHG